MKKSSRIILHACFWAMIPLTVSLYDWSAQADPFFGMAGNAKSFLRVLVGNLQSLFLHPDTGSDPVSPSNLAGVAFNLFYYVLYPVAIFYLFYGYFSPKALTGRSLRSIFLPAAFMIAAPYAIIKPMSFFVLPVHWGYTYYLSLTYVITFFCSASGFVFSMAERWLATERAAKQNLLSELALLKNQVNPHFLFNTLNNIDSLIRSNADKASETLLRLSAILRYMIYDTNIAMVPLTGEIAHIESYMELQKLQFVNRELASLKIAGDPGQVAIAPMLFIPLVENAFKHCTDKGKPGAIRFSFSFRENEVYFESVNLFNRALKINKDGSGGVGLNILRRRLELLYPGRHELSLSEDNSTFTVKLTVKTHGH